VNFLVCPYDGANVKVVTGAPRTSLSLPVMCPACGRRFEFADGNLTEQPRDETEDGSET
jgi:nitrite reductase/ring-hydroxylating ferredoxin subunit